MTGFGKATATIGGKTMIAEVRSLNSKQLDMGIRLPSALKNKELDFRNIASKSIERGKADISIFCENREGEKEVSINTPLAKAYYNEFKKLADELNVPSDDLLNKVLSMPEILKNTANEPGEEEINEVKKLMDLAIADFLDFRIAEGKVLALEFEKRIQSILSLLKEIETLDQKRAPAMRNKIQKSLHELLGKDRIDQNRLEQEMIFYIEKIDISEEKLRLQTHCNYFLSTMTEIESVGRKLGFISQEMGREINTIGSKANDSSIQKIVVQMKDELEKVKEQLLNVL